MREMKWNFCEKRGEFCERVWGILETAFKVRKGAEKAKWIVLSAKVYMNITDICANFHY